MASRIIHNGPPLWARKKVMQEPPKGITTDCKVVRVIDGDTVDVEITRTGRGRLDRKNGGEGKSGKPGCPRIIKKKKKLQNK